MIWSDIRDGLKRFFANTAPPSSSSPPAPKHLICPYCLSRTPRGAYPLSCEGCSRELPPLYVDDADRFPVNPVHVLGWANHGKTVFLYALTLMLDRLDIVMKSYSYAAVTEASRRMLIDVRTYQRTGKMPAPTPLGVDESYVMLLEALDRWGDRALVIRDCAGEVVNHIEIDVELTPFLLKSQTAFMVISLPDLELSPGLSMDMLMVNYLNTLIRHGGLSQRRNLVVVLSKADSIENLPENLQTYLLDDPLCAALAPHGVAFRLPGGEAPSLSPEHLEAYLGSMRRAHQDIERWLERERLAVNFSNQARRRGVEVRFCLVSATGSPVGEDNSIPVAWQPRRVLDPYFWALELEGSAGASVS